MAILRKGSLDRGNSKRKDPREELVWCVQGLVKRTAWLEIRLGSYERSVVYWFNMIPNPHV